MLLYNTLLIAGIACIAAALALVLRPWRVPAAVAGWIGLLLLHLSTYTTLEPWVLPFYAVATLIVAGIHYLSPKGEPGGKRSGTLYLGLGALAGGLVGMIAGARFMMLGVVLGCLFGQLAFCRTPHGNWIKFPSSNFIHYFCARGLQTIVAVAMIGVAIEGFIF